MTIHKVCYKCGRLGHKKDMVRAYEKEKNPHIIIGSVDNQRRLIFFHKKCWRKELSCPYCSYYEKKNCKKSDRFSIETKMGDTEVLYGCPQCKKTFISLG